MKLRIERSQVTKKDGNTRVTSYNFAEIKLREGEVKRIRQYLETLPTQLERSIQLDSYTSLVVFGDKADPRRRTHQEPEDIKDIITQILYEHGKGR